MRKLGNVARLALLIGLALIVIGALEIGFSRTLPAFTDENSVEALQFEDPPADLEAQQAFFEGWHQRRWALEGGRFVLFDKGAFDLTAGLLLIGCTLVLPGAAVTVGVRRFLLEFGAGVGAVVVLAAGSIYSDTLEFQRDRLNAFADTLAIPIVSALISLPFILVFAIFVVSGATILREQKARLWPAVSTTKRRATVCGLVFLPPMALLLATALEGRPYSASWLSLTAVTGAILVIASWCQAALTPPNRGEIAPPEGVMQTG